MPGDWKQMIQENVIQAAVTTAVTTAFNYVPGLAAKGITLARNGMEWAFGTRNEAESDRVGKIGEVAENELAEYERKALKELMSWMDIDPIAKKKRRRFGRQRMTSTVAEVGEIEEEEENHEFCPGAGDPRVVGNESRSVSSKRKEREYYNYIGPMTMPSGQRFRSTSKRGDDGSFTFICCTTATQFEWTYPGSELGYSFTFVSCNSLSPNGEYNGKYTGRTFEVVLGTQRFKQIYIVRPSLRPYLVSVDAWADSSSGQSIFVFSLFPLRLDFDRIKLDRLARKNWMRKGCSYMYGWNFKIDFYDHPLNLYYLYFFMTCYRHTVRYSNYDK